MKYSSFSKSNLTQLRSIIDQHFDAIEKQTGVKLKIGNIRFDAYSFRTKLEAEISQTNLSPTVVAQMKESAKAEFERLAPLVGADPLWYGRMVKLSSNGLIGIVSKIITRRRVRPIQMTFEGGSSRANAHYVKENLVSGNADVYAKLSKLLGE